MKFERCPLVELYDGVITKMYPFHVSMEGMENKILCREDEDYDTFVKVLAITAHKRNVSIIVYCIVSNHIHCVILSESYDNAIRFGEESKRVYSMYLSNKYKDSGALRSVDIHIVYLDSDRYLRNAIAYDIRNALDNGAYSVQEYKWSSYRAAFCRGVIKGSTRKVSELSKREKCKIMHTHLRLAKVKWLINGDNELEPASFTHWKYLESGYLNDHAFFLKNIGIVNTSEMKQNLVLNLKEKKTDSELFRSVNDICKNKYLCNLNELSLEKKAHLLLHIYRAYRTSPNQLSRIFELRRENVLSLLTRARSNGNA